MMADLQHFDIAIIGGGMVGASLACLLSASQPQLTIALLEKNPLPTDLAQRDGYNFDARSTALAHGSVELFQQLELWSLLQKHATPIRQVHVSDRGHFAGSLIKAEDQHLDALGFVIENAWLGGVLSVHAQQQPNIRCFSPAQVTAVIPQPHGALLQIHTEVRGDFAVTCSLAVIADGGDSPMRHALGINTRIADYQQTAISTNVAFSQSHQGIAYERFTDQGPLALLPLGGSCESQRGALVWTLPKQDAARYMQMPDQEFLVALQQRFGYRLGRFNRVGKRYAYPLQLVTAEEQVRSGLVLVGNAAHFLHPVAGQGFNLALRDCVCLAEVLLEANQCQRALGDLATLEQYLERQRQDQLITIEFSDRLVRLFSTASLPWVVLRHLGFAAMAGLPPLKQLLTTRAMGTSGRRPRWREAANHQ